MKPKPQVPRKIWVNDYGTVLGGLAYASLKQAEEGAHGPMVALQIQFVEVIPEKKGKS